MLRRYCSFLKLDYFCHSSTFDIFEKFIGGRSLNVTTKDEKAKEKVEVGKRTVCSLIGERVRAKLVADLHAAVVMYLKVRASKGCGWVFPGRGTGLERRYNSATYVANEHVSPLFLSYIFLSLFIFFSLVLSQSLISLFLSMSTAFIIKIKC